MVGSLGSRAEMGGCASEIPPRYLTYAMLKSESNKMPQVFLIELG